MIRMRRCVFLVAALCVTITTINYGLNSLYRPEREFESSWTPDEHRWDITTATAEEVLESPCSLREAARQDGFFGEHMNFSVPVLQWDGSFSQSEWQRLKNRKPPYGWQGLPLTLVETTLALLKKSSSSRLFERKSPGQCVRCAVVGNGGILRGSKQGTAIDSHDFVFRVNGAVTTRFEEDVGTKTSFYGFTTNTMKNSLISYRHVGFTKIPQGSEVRYIFIPSDERDYVMMAAAIQGLTTITSGADMGDWPSQYFGFKTPVEHFKILHPDFISYVTESFLNSPLLRWRQTADFYMPSTGALMLLAALHTCDQVSAYGFITRNYYAFSDHYYDAVKMPLRFFSNHDMQMEKRLWQNMDRWKIMTLFRRTRGK